MKARLEVLLDELRRKRRVLVHVRQIEAERRGDARGSERAEISRGAELSVERHRTELKTSRRRVHAQGDAFAGLLDADVDDRLRILVGDAELRVIFEPLDDRVTQRGRERR